MSRFSPACAHILPALVLAYTMAGCASPAGGVPTSAATPFPLTGAAAGGASAPATGATAGTSPGAAAGATSPSAGAASGAQAGGTALATANGYTLTRDNAEAFVDALQFALGEIGRPQTFSASEREQLIQGLAQNFATQTPQAQAEVAKARETWAATRANWPSTSQPDRQTFIDGVLVIAVGEQRAAQLTGRGGATAPSGGDSWSAEAKEKCENGSYEDQMFYCHGVITPPAPSW